MAQRAACLLVAARRPGRSGDEDQLERRLEALGEVPERLAQAALHAVAPYRVPDAFTRTEALDWFVAYRAGNPMADLYRKRPVQEMISEGFGTLTNQPLVASAAQGVWTDGRWSVVFERPLATNDGGDYQFETGARDMIAFAVWEGSSENVSGRKQHSQWVVFEVQP